jgi:hypothetical protein
MQEKPEKRLPSLNIFWLLIFTGHMLGTWFANIYLI